MKIMHADKVLMKAAKTFEARAALYQDNNARAGAMLASAFPDGIRLEDQRDHERYIIFSLIIVKLSRYAVNWENGHQDSMHDAMVYAAILESLDAGGGL